MKGLQMIARRALLTRTKNDAGLVALIPKASQFGQSPSAKPDWPFCRQGQLQTLPIRATCLDGGTVNLIWHAFAKPRFENGEMVETAEDHAGRIGAAFERAVDCRGEDVTVDGVAARLTYQLADMILQRDPDEADAYHYSAAVRIRIIAE